MLRQSSNRGGHRSKKLRASHSFQAFLLVAVAIWIVYQLTHSFGERRPVVVETGTGSSNAGSARRRMGRKGLVHFAGRQSVVDGIAGVSSWSDGASSDDRLSSKAGGGEGDEEEPEGDDDDSAAGADVHDDDDDDGLAAAADDEEDDGIDFQARDGSREDGSKAVQGGTDQDGLNISLVAAVNGTGTVPVPDGAAVRMSNATVGAADGHGTVPALMSGFASALNNISSLDVASLRDRGTAGDVANSFAVGVPGPEEKPTSKHNFGNGFST